MIHRTLPVAPIRISTRSCTATSVLRRHEKSCGREAKAECHELIADVSMGVSIEWASQAFNAN
jgi:hypothetical protein